MNIKTTLQIFYSARDKVTLVANELIRTCVVGMSLVGVALTTSAVFADPALMQPVEDISFQELPPPWLMSENSGALEPEKKITTPTSSKQKMKQVPSATAHVPQMMTLKTVPAQSSFQSIMDLARKGDRDAQYDIGMRYQYGNGVQKSRSKAHRWLNKSANAGSARAQYALSIFYQQYARNKQGIKKALLWIKKAADQGLADAQYNLGMMFKNGSLVHQNPAEARKWLSMAAAQGHVSAQLAMNN